MKFTRYKLASSLMSMSLLVSCGGNNSTSDDQAGRPASLASTVVMGGAPLATPTAAVAITPAAASQFLAQASFGATTASMNEVVSVGKAAWIEAQFTKPQLRHKDYVRQIAASLSAGSNATPNQFFESFWRWAIRGEDQLRQRMTYALSQIFVISIVEGNLYNRPAGVADYYDTLGRYAFGNFRDLLQAVATHPMMGIYLSHLHNQKEDGVRVPDENFAREIMQLMSIGLYQLNQDGSVKTNAGTPIPTYTHDDVAGLAKVFTGWSWCGSDKSEQRFWGVTVDPIRDWTPMQMYPAFHSTTSKTFLGVTTNGSGEADLKVALDTLFNHPNVGPFIGRQLIQRLVTSNPSPAYVGRVAAAFANNGAGVRGDMRAVLRAILLDPEAADNGHPKKLREPVLRLANWARAFNARSASGRYLMVNLDDPLSGISQTPMRSPSVFNFYRPSYTPPNTSLSAAQMVAPEMQIAGEPGVTGYLNYMQEAIVRGVGTQYDITADYANELVLINTPAQLVDRVQLLLMAGGMSTTLRNQIISAVTAIEQPTPKSWNAEQIIEAKKNRVYMAIYLTMASPEYLAQR